MFIFFIEGGNYLALVIHSFFLNLSSTNSMVEGLLNSRKFINSLILYSKLLNFNYSGLSD